MKKILLASQYKVLLERYAHLLENCGLDIFVTTRGAEALALHKEHDFSLIVTDFELEEMSGCTLCTLLRQEEGSLHVPIILTCQNIPKRIERGQLSGASAIVLKPIDPLKLLKAIGDQIGLQLIRGKRVALKSVVTIKKNGQEFICVSRDISNTGLLLKSDFELNLGNRITSAFTLPDFCHVEIDGEIVRYMTDLECDNLYGVKFIAVESRCQKAINRYIDSRSRTQSAAKAVKS